MDAIDNNLGSFLKQKRKEKGLTLVQLGEKIGVTNGTISKWERGHIKNMKRDKIEALCNVLDIPPLVLINGIEKNDEVKIEQVTPQEFKQEVTSLLNKTTDLSEQQKQFFLNTLDLICSDKE